MRQATLARLGGALILVTAVASIGQGGNPTQRASAPFLAFSSGHVGQLYDDTCADGFDAPVTSVSIVTGALPPGLSLAPSGEVTGRPRVAEVAHLVLKGTPVAGGADIFLRATLPVFSVDEHEIKKGQSFETPGPYTVTQRTVPFTWTSSLDGQTYSGTLYIFTPDASAGTVPLLVHHRGRGFAPTEYVDLLTQVASYGTVCASVSDEQAFYGAGTPIPTYDAGSLGMEFASSAQEAAMDQLLSMSNDAADALYQRIDVNNVFFSGHSRGGGATHATHTRYVPLRAKGVIYFMAFDLRYFYDTASSVPPPATTPVPPISPTQVPTYGIPTLQRRLPSLMFSAEHDGDLVYPYVDELIDRANGPTTFVTVLGADHNYLGDNHYADGAPTITRDQEHTRIASFVVAFLKRWAHDDLSLEGFLYGDEHQASNTVAVSTWRRTSPSLMVDDFQDADPKTNRLGGPNFVFGPLTRAEESIYPQFGDFASLGIKHNVIDFATNKGQPAVFAMGLVPVSGSPVDVTGFGSLRLRIMESTNQGYHVDCWLALQDQSFRQASVKITNADGTSLGFLAAAGTTTDRFVTAAVPIPAFAAANPKVDLHQVRQVALYFQKATQLSTIAIDDVRFEGGSFARAHSDAFADAELDADAFAFADALIVK